MGSAARRGRAVAADLAEARRRSRPLVARRLAPRARGPGGRPPLRRRRGAQGPIADRAPDHAARLPRRRVRPRRAPLAPVADALPRRRRASTADERRLRRPPSGVVARRSADRLRRRPRPGLDDQPPAPDLVGRNRCGEATRPRARQPRRRCRPAVVLARWPPAGVHRHRCRRSPRRSATLAVGDGPSVGHLQRADRRAGPADRRVGLVRPADGRGGTGSDLALERGARGHRRRPGPRRPVPRDARRDDNADDRSGPAHRRLRPGRRRRSHCDLGRARRTRRGGLGGRGRWAAPGDPRGVSLAAPIRGRRSRGAQPARTGRADPGLARLAARRRPEAPADDPPHPRRPDGSLGPGWHARRDGAVRGRLPGADAEHPRLDHLRRPVGQGPVRQLGRHRRRGRARIRRRPREAGPRRPEAARGDGPELRRLPDPVAHRRRPIASAPPPARTGSPTRRRPGRTRTSACTTTAAPASAIR